MAAAVLATITVSLCEFFNRPILEARGTRSFGRSPAEIESAIFTWNAVVYAAALIILVWNIAAHFIGPQNMGRTRRLQLMKATTRAASQ